MEHAKIGMIGIGLMGHGIALNLARKGWRPGFLDHPGNRPVDDLLALGATRHADRRDLARASDVIILCVSGSPEVEDILLGEAGIIAAARPGTVIIDCSTAIPSSTERLARAAEDAGLRFMDAAMTRTPLEAEAGRLNLLVGADPALFDQVRPLLSAFAENITHAGPVGAGHKLKLIHNYVSLGMITLLAEAAACAARGGIAPELLVDVLARGGGHGAALDRLVPFLLSGDTSKLQFFVANARKDLDYYTHMAGDLAAGHGVADAVLSVLQTMVAAGHGDRFMAEAPLLIEGDDAMNGTKV